MSKSNAFENDWLKLIFNAVPIPGIADNASETPLASLYVSLHTDDPGEAGDQGTSEISYDEYARVAVSRSEAGWTVTGNSVSPVEHIEFAKMTAGVGGPATHWGIGIASTGAGKLLYSGPFDEEMPVIAGIVPRIMNTSTVTED
ncbi:hypothetical protein [Bosea sp. (in: a-proteobacteria)]|uniref:phage tail fiber protein n=1 Tax=Bosea sp. (in: a-proteobacteria) TaxID=1871050 RepID=UPI001ACE2130|nr:hypothetical protein [Bosea sp. (in: a-proteobacteria)]MBN9444395.1 hypothetical protein [Bosea sp. (in: a-proteobacteria)]